MQPDVVSCSALIRSLDMSILATLGCIFPFFGGINREDDTMHIARRTELQQNYGSLTDRMRKANNNNGTKAMISQIWRTLQDKIHPDTNGPTMFKCCIHKGKGVRPNVQCMRYSDPFWPYPQGSVLVRIHRLS